MRRIHIIGRKNHGKTRLMVELVEEFTRRGLRVGTIKHTHHRHELDTPGKDSHRHREAGAAAVGILSQTMSAAFLPAGQAQEGEDRYSVFESIFAPCDLVLVEGDSRTQAPKIEVWRSELETAPLAAEDRSILAVVTDDPLNVETQILRRADVLRLANWILEKAVETPAS